MDGLPMLVQQGALALEWWIGANPPLEIMMKAAMAPPPTEAE
jgi:shikimate 5-dehydrogenase